MKAVRVSEFGPVEDARLEDIPVPTPGDGQIVVEARAIGVNFADLLVMAGKYQVKPPLPFTAGKELAGVVSAVGPGVSRWSVGDRVMGQVEYGAFAEYVAVGADQCSPVPEAMPFEKAAAMGIAYQTGWFALFDRGDFKPGDTVLVNGASGGVGLATVQLVRALGGTALAGVTSMSKADAVLAAGAHHVIDLSGEDLRNGLRDQVYAVTDGKGCDICVDMVGGDAFDASLRALAWCGRLVVVGFAAGRIPEVRANYLLVKNIAVTGLQWSDYRDRTPERVADAQERMSAMVVDGTLDVPVMETFPLARFADALGVLADRRVVGKVVMVP